MSDRTRIPARPLDHTDIERIRSQPGVRSLISLGSTSIHDRPAVEQPPTERMVLLVGRTVSAFEYDGSGWSSEVLETDADRHDHLQCALDQLEAH